MSPFPHSVFRKWRRSLPNRGFVWLLALIIRQFGETAGWLRPAVDFADFKEQFGVFAPRLGLLVPALFVIDTSDRVLYCEVVSALDAKVDFDAARDVLLG